MFFCRGVRLSPAAPHQGWNSLHAQVKSIRLGDITLSLHKNRHTVECPRGFCAYGWHPAPSPYGKRKTGDVFTTRNCWNSSRFITSHREHFSGVTLNLSRSQRKSINDRMHCNSLPTLTGLHEKERRKLDPVHSFSTEVKPGAPRFYTTAVQMRGLSTAATPKHKPGAGEEADRDKGQDQGPVQASPKAPEPEPEPDPEQGKPNKTQQLKKVFKEYGAVGVSFHVCMSLMSLGMFYLAVSSGIDMAGLLCKLGFSESVVQSKMAAGTSTFVLAYAVHKLFAPVRMSITLVSVPLIVRYFRKTGLFKPPASTP